MQCSSFLNDIHVHQQLLKARKCCVCSQTTHANMISSYSCHVTCKVKRWNNPNMVTHFQQVCRNNNKLCGRPPQYAPAPCKLIFRPLTLKVVSESRVMWATSVPILIFLGLSVLDLGPMYATDRQTDRHTSLLNAHTLGAGHNNNRS